MLLTNYLGMLEKEVWHQTICCIDQVTRYLFYEVVVTIFKCGVYFCFYEYLPGIYRFTAVPDSNVSPAGVTWL